MEERKFQTQRTGPLLTGERPLPHNHDAERAVLGSILLEPQRCLQLAMPVLRGESCFHSPAHQAIWNALVELERKAVAIDLVTLPDALRAAGQLDRVGGESYLAQVINSVPSSANFENWLQIVSADALLRELIRLSSDTVSRCLDSAEAEPAALIDDLQRRLNEISLRGSTDAAVLIGDLMNDTLTRISMINEKGAGSQGIPTGYDDLDNLLNGLKGGEMLVLAARPSIGKTTLAMNIAANVSLGVGSANSPGKPRAVGVFSLEMDKGSLAMRLAFSEARVSQRDCSRELSRSQMSRLVAAAERLKACPMAIDDTGTLSILELRAKARRLKEKYNIQFIVIDYLQLMRGSGLNKNANREQEVAQISGGIKALAKELMVPILVLAQLNRQSEGQAGVTKPKLSHLRESGSIEQDADVVLLLHRDREEQYAPNPTGEPKRLKTEIIVAKHRNGETGSIEVTFVPDYTRFENKSSSYDDDNPLA